MTGSGMGCPDWPKCFGQWIPPTDISQLPVDYKEQFKVAGKEIADFDVFKTWVEYVNRLMGVLIGGFAILTAFFSLKMYAVKKKVTWLSVGGLILVILQGGIGAYVVRTNLSTSMITVHMMMALLIVAVLLTAMIFSHESTWTKKAESGPVVTNSMWGIGLGVICLTIVQIVLGTQVREEIDLIAISFEGVQRELWIGELGKSYSIHKFFYYVIVAVIIGWTYIMKPWMDEWKEIKNLVIGLLALVAGEIVLGLTMHHFGIPAFAQPLHLLLATGIFICEFTLIALMFLMYRKQNEITETGIGKTASSVAL